MRKALVVDIDYYAKISPLFGCVNDAHSVKSVLERNSEGTVNFGVKLLTGIGPAESVTRTNLKEGVREMFADDSEIALFYFVGHGHIETTEGYLESLLCDTFRRRRVFLAEEHKIEERGLGSRISSSVEQDFS